MVKVDKKPYEINRFGLLRLKHQLIIRFGVISLICCLIISLLIILFIQKQVTQRIISDSASYVCSNVDLENERVIKQMVTVLQTSLYNLGQLINDIRQVISDVFITYPNYKFAGIYNVYPTYDLSSSDKEGLSKAQEQLQNCNINVIQQYETSSICIDSVSDIQQTTNEQKQLISYLLELDNNVNSLFSTAFLQERTQRIIVQIYTQQNTQNINIYKSYPASFIDESQSQFNIDSTFYKLQQQNSQKSKRQGNRVFVQGPYDVQVGNQKLQVMSLSVTFKANINIQSTIQEIYFHIRLEMKMKVIDSFVKAHGFRSKSEIIVLNKRGQFVYASDYWHVTSQNQYIFDQNISNFSGLDQTSFQTLIQQETQMKISKLNKEGQTKIYQITPIFIQDQFDPNDQRDFTKIGIEDPVQDSYFTILLYSEEDEMYKVKDKIKNLSLQLENLTVKICVTLSIITIIIVCAVSYAVSTQVDRPLRFLIVVLKQLIMSKTLKQSTLQKISHQIQFQLLQSQYQVKDLLISFNSLIETLIERNFNNKNNNIKPEIIYPLNEFEINYVKQTQNKQNIFDWEYLIDKIQKNCVSFNPQNDISKIQS
ncbi:transmembrane protein, putative (macronuclear) [Tetrahymena thermophila SB210]|uniref:Transmembrane protein, putative n=1 Tax=Tetrahymena thermophila (strain SB210) TaxID=312017 RepID=I7MAJ8_TETTS|nr:transmembrane protein, putative [Tetrahymena thermophila SB210]EAS04730.2 transmembrane protein, putative [Tetrahymena thermophila SB210]|eukprot:XP_001024975.2 transmembrane protein, putative [Tetrahymena thermophila SB210]